MSDIEIARAAKKIHIRDVAAKVNIPEENLIPYGHDAAKINFNFIKKSLLHNIFVIVYKCWKY